MIELVLYDYLTEKLDVPVYTERRNIEDDSFVLIEKTGSSESNHVRHATFAIQSYGPSMYEAAVLNDTVHGVVADMPEIDAISRADITGDYNYTDTTEKKYRYQMVVEIIYTE